MPNTGCKDQPLIVTPAAPTPLAPRLATHTTVPPVIIHTLTHTHAVTHTELVLRSTVRHLTLVLLRRPKSPVVVSVSPPLPPQPHPLPPLAPPSAHCRGVQCKQLFLPWLRYPGRRGLARRPRPANDQWRCGVSGFSQRRQRTAGLLENPPLLIARGFSWRAGRPVCREAVL